jgi:hypothetical protein
MVKLMFRVMTLAHADYYVYFHSAAMEQSPGSTHVRWEEAERGMAKDEKSGRGEKEGGREAGKEGREGGRKGGRERGRE